MVAAVILAAGAGRRMGNRPKALLLLEGRTFLECAILTCRGGGCEAVHVVTRPDTPEIERVATALGARVVLNPDPDRGMFSSVRTGIRSALDSDPELLLLYPVDHPHVRPDTVAGLIASQREVDACWLRPTHCGRGGHPVAVDASTARRLIDRDPADSLRDALRSLGLEPVSVPVSDPGVLANLNTPQDSGTD